MSIDLHQIPIEQLNKIHFQLKPDVLDLLQARVAIESGASAMGTSPKSVARAISAVEDQLSEMLKKISRIRDGFSGMISQ